MRTKLVFMAVGVLCLGIIGAGPAHAQVVRSSSFTTNVPFEFTVGNRTLPAGTYTFETVLGTPTENDQVGILVVRSLDREHYVALVTDVAQTIETSEKASAIFRRHAGRVFLSEVREKGKLVGLQLRPTATATETADDSEDQETITLVAAVTQPRLLPSARNLYLAR